MPILFYFFIGFGQLCLCVFSESQKDIGVWPALVYLSKGQR